MGLSTLAEGSDAISSNLDYFDEIYREGIPDIERAPLGRETYETSLKREKTSTRRFSPIYSLEFLEIHDTLAKYIPHIETETNLTDDFVAEVIESILNYTRSEVAIYLLDCGFPKNVTDEIYERLTDIEELNGESDKLYEKIDILSAELFELFDDNKSRLTQKDYLKAAFAISKISEKANYSKEFDFLDNAKKYLETFLGISYENLSKDKKTQLVKIISKGAKNPVFDLLNNYGNPYFEYYQINTIKGIDDPNKWYSLYKGAIVFLIKVFAKQNESKEDTYKRIVEQYGMCDGLFARNYSLIAETSTYTDFKDNNPGSIDFANFGESLQRIIVSNSKCSSEKEWKTFSISVFLLEVIGKINQLNSFKRGKLEEANNELIQKFLDASNDHVQFEQSEELSTDKYSVVLSKITVDGEVFPVMYRIAKIKSKESMLRKSLVKGTPVSGMKDKFRLMVVLPKGSLSDEQQRSKICMALINTHMTFLGNEILDDSIKNTFETGKANNYSIGTLRCFKYASKFEVSNFSDTVEIMILEKYPDDHDDYEMNMYKKLRETFAICDYPRAMEELAEEVSRKALIGFTRHDIHIIRPLLSYVQGMNKLEIGNISQKFKGALLLACLRISESSELGIYKSMSETCLKILNTLVD